MKEEPNYPSIDPELEARIVALVLGEASDFEREDLNRLIEERPELAAFMEEIQNVHGLLRDVGAGEPLAEDDDWKLSAEKRNAVLAVIRGEADEQPEIPFAVRSADQRRSKQTSLLGNIAKIAAVLLVAGFFASMMLPSQHAAREVASLVDASKSLKSEASDPGDQLFMANGAENMAPAEEYIRAAEPTEVADFDYKKSPKSALAEIGKSLSADATLSSPYYLQDDVQYYPADPEFSVSQEANEVRERTVEMERRAPAKVNGPVRGQSQQTAEDFALIPEAVESGGEVAAKDSTWQDSSSFFSGPRDRDGETTDLSTRMSGMGMGNRPAVKSVPDLTLPALGSQDSGQGRIALGGVVANDSAATEEEPNAEEPSQGFAGGTNLQFSESDARGNDFVENMPEDRFGRELGGGGTSMSGATKPMQVGDGGRMKEVEELSEHHLFGDANVPAPVTQSPPTTRLSLREDVEKKDGTTADLEEVVSEGIAFDDRRILDEKVSASRQVPAPISGTAIGQPFGESQVGQANQNQNWDLEVATGDDSLRTDNRNGVDKYSERVPSKQKASRGEVLPQRDQLAANEPNGRFWYALPEQMLEDDEASRTRVPKFAAIAGDRITREVARKSVAPAGLDETSAAEETFSTFSLHVSDVSFKLARAALASGSWPEAAKVRIEEFVNAFDYGDPMPSQSQKVACRVEQSVHPFLQQRNLLRVSMRTAAAGRSSNTPLRLTFLLDNSGSMERLDRQQTVRRAFALLAQQLKPIDQVTLISFARQPRLLADKVSGAQSSQLVGLIENLPSEGGTNIEAALQLAFEKAREQQVDQAQNRIILLTDGAVNLGDAKPESLSRMITTMRSAGIAFDAAGISAEGLNDEILEALTRKGDGRYYLLDSLEAADDGFARQIAGALRPSAGNVKVQIEFNPKRVGRYKLLGFEKHRLNKEDFRNDKVDAAEMAAAEAGVAVYQFEAKPDGEGDVGSVSVRFRDLSTGQMVENRWPIPYEPDAPRLDQAAPSLRIATCAALLAAKLKGDTLGEIVDLRTLANLIAELPDQDRNVDRVGQLQQMIGQARQVSGK